MKKITIILFLLSACFTNAFGQTANDSITMKITFWEGYKFYQNGKKLNLNQTVAVMRTNEQAYQLIKSARSNLRIGQVIGLVGGGMIGWTLGEATSGQKPNWALAGAGVALVVATIPISYNFNKKVKKAMDTYNAGVQTSSLWDKSELNLAVTADGIGLNLRF